MAPTGALQLSAPSHGHLQWYQSLPLLQVVVFLWSLRGKNKKQILSSRLMLAFSLDFSTEEKQKADVCLQGLLLS